MRSAFPILNTDSVGTERDTLKPVVLVGFQQQGNLGIGYLAATLRKFGYRVEVADFESDPANIYTMIEDNDPIIVGFSLIFQFYIHRFGELIRYLRARGVRCHFTMGGHFPTLSTAQTLSAIPELDSVVRYEGEYTLLELADRLSTSRPWQHIRGIALRTHEGIVQNQARTLIENLDELPYPERNFEPERVLGHKAMPLLASRGCARTCSFCSIHTFYRSAPGKVVRTRRPAEVVREMKHLHNDRGITIFLFQDDDFPLFGPAWKRWTRELVAEIHASGLANRIIWKINCRADAVDLELLAEMKAAGLYLVYMGLESGSEAGLETLNKGITVAQNLRAVQMLKNLGLMYEFGFMLFDPSSTFESVEANLRFLEAITADGSAAAVFCRMLPYDGTPIKDELERTGRLRGDICNPDYDFQSPQMNAFYAALQQVLSLTGWIHGYRALSPQINWAWNEVAVLERLFPELAGIEEYREQLRRLTRDSNALLFYTVREMAAVYSRGATWMADSAMLTRYADQYLAALITARNEFFSNHQDTLLAALSVSSLDTQARASMVQTAQA